MPPQARLPTAPPLSDSAKPSLKRAQARSEKACRDIAQAVSELSADNDPAALSARAISVRSGYSIGAIYHHFSSVERLLLRMLEGRRRDALDALTAMLREAPPDTVGQTLFGELIDLCFAVYRRPPRRVLTHVLRLQIKHAEHQGELAGSIDALARPLAEALRRNRSGTVRPVAEDEARLALRAIQTLIRSPFAEGDPTAGDQRHRDLTVDACLRMFGSHAPGAVAPPTPERAGSPVA